VAAFAAAQVFGFGFAETQLHGAISLMVQAADLSDKARPSFDERNRHSVPLLVENLGHPDFLADKPFEHLQFLLTSCWGLSVWARPHHPAAAQSVKFWESVFLSQNKTLAPPRGSTTANAVFLATLIAAKVLLRWGSKREAQNYTKQLPLRPA
jgi:hypothetical protein